MYTIAVKDAIEAGKKNLLLIPSLPFKILVAVGTVFPVLIFSKWGILSRQIFEEYFWASLVLTIFAIFWNIGWRSLHSAAWKIWALENVIDAHRLYEIAERRGMIYKRDNWLGKLEYKTREQTERLAELEQRLLLPRQMENTGLLGKPMETTAFKYEFNRLVLTVIPFLVFGIIAVLWMKTVIALFFPFGLVMAIALGRVIYLSTRPASLVLTPQDLQFKNDYPIPWKIIHTLRVENRPYGRSTKDYLVIGLEHVGHPVEYDISDLGKSVAEIEETLYEYWTWGKKQA